jgi:hypothetical protein
MISTPTTDPQTSAGRGPLDLRDVSLDEDVFEPNWGLVERDGTYSELGNSQTRPE